MQRAVRHISAILGRVIFIGFSIQIVFGMTWMCLNFSKLPQFGESLFYVEISRNFICDEYTGILYPVFLLLARGIEGLAGLPYYCVMYVVQLLVACYAAHRLLMGLKKTKRALNLWGSLAVLTLPMAMQCHLAVLPYSLVSSFFLLELSISLETVRKGMLRVRQMVKLASFWLLCALLLPEYLLLGAIPPVLVLLWGLVRIFGLVRRGNCQETRRQDIWRFARQFVIFLAFGATIIGMNSLTQVKGYYGKNEKSLEACLVSRTAWTSLMSYYEGFPEQLREILDWGDVQASAYYADNMAMVFGPAVEEALGTEEAREFFLALSKQAWEQNRAHILHEIAWDAAAYTVSPIALQMQLTGRGYDSYSGRNYEIMRHYTPVLSRIYMDYSCWWFAAALCLGAILGVFCIFLDRSLISGRNFFSVLILGVSCLGLIFWYTMQGAGMMDYKNTIGVTCVWMVFSLLLMEKGMGAYACTEGNKTA